MADETTTTGTGASAEPEDQFKNFPPIPAGHTRVFLNRSWAPRNQPLKGPGWAYVPDSWLPALRAAPDLVKTDAQGAPLANTLAASAAGAGVGSAVDGGAAIPNVERDEEGDPLDPDAEGAPDPVVARRAELREHALSEERTGGQTIGETDSHLDESRRLTSQPGYTPEPSSGTSARSSQPEGPRPATKSALRDSGDLDSLKALGEKNGVKGAADWTNKDDAVDALYDARVVL